MRGYGLGAADSDQVPRQDLFTYLEDHANRSAFEAIHRYPDTGIRLRAIWQMTRRHELHAFDWSAGHEQIRTARHVHRGREDGDARLLIPMATIRFRVGADDLASTPGTAALITPSAGGFEMYAPAGRGLGMRIPRGRIPCLDPSQPIRIVRWSSGLALVAIRMIMNLHLTRDTLTEDAFEVGCDHAVDLLAMAVAGDDAPDVAAIRRYVRRHVEDRELSLASAAHKLHWSPRRMQEALRQVGTSWAALVREARLMRGRDMLCRGALVADAASACGYSEKAFSRAFRSAFGETPRECRHRAADLVFLN